MLRGLAVQFVRISHPAFQISTPTSQHPTTKNHQNHHPLTHSSNQKNKIHHGQIQKRERKKKLVINHYTLKLPSTTELQQHSLIPKTYRTLLNILTITPLQPFITTSPLTALTSPAYSDPDSDFYSGAHALQLIAYVIAHVTISYTIYVFTSPERYAVPPRIQLLIWSYYQFALLVVDASLLYSARISWSLQGSLVNPVREWRGVDWILVGFTLMAALTRVAFLFRVGFPKQLSPEERRKAWDEDNKKFWDGVNDGTSSIVCNG